jgi:hypothetical protein
LIFGRWAAGAAPAAGTAGVDGMGRGSLRTSLIFGRWTIGAAPTADTVGVDGLGRGEEVEVASSAGTLGAPLLPPPPPPPSFSLILSAILV